MRYLLLILLVFSISPAVASANFPDSYENLALQYWHTAPRCEQVTYTWMGDLDAVTGVIGAIGAADISGCQMYIKIPYWFDAPKSIRCAMFIHEWGHLIGMQHSTNPHSVMRPELYVPHFCNRKGWRATRTTIEF